MPLYFFNLENHETEHDSEGTELPSADAARAQAVVFAGDYLSDNPDIVWDGRHMKVEVRDEAGTILLNINVTAEDPNNP